MNWYIFLNEYFGGFALKIFYHIFQKLILIFVNLEQGLLQWSYFSSFYPSYEGIIWLQISAIDIKVS